MKHRHHTCVIICGDGHFSIRHMDLFSMIGFPLHLCRGPWWWSQSLIRIPKG